MFKKLFVDVFLSKSSFPITKDYHSQVLGEYYLIFPEEFHKMNRLLVKFDKNGIPLCKTYIDVQSDELHYYPITIGQVGLAIFQSYINNKNNAKKEHFLKIADWFVQNAIIENDLAYWLSYVPKPEYNVSEPWKSAFAQSRAISILLRAWQITNNETYLNTATKALGPFKIDINNGGVAAHLSDNKPFYEEYVASYPTMVLDGGFFSLMGLYDYIRAFSNDKNNSNYILANELFENGYKSLLNWLPEFDLGFWIRFNHCEIPNYPINDPCTINYLRLIKVQCQVLYNITGDNKFIEFKNKLDGYDNFYNILKMYHLKYKSLKKLNRL